MRPETPFVIGGLGNAGQQIAEAVLADPAGSLRITAVAANSKDKAKAKLDDLGLDVPVITAAEAPDHAPVLVECATFDAFRTMVEPSVRAGHHVIALSVGALATNLDLIDLADAAGATLHIASGTLPGLDILRAAREGEIESVALHSQVLPASLTHEPYIAEQGIDLAAAQRGPVQVFSGSAREAARHFPRHFNVAVSLSLAGIGLDRTEVHIQANGTLPGVRHVIKITGALVELELAAQNFPSPANNRTSRIVAPSVVAALRELNAPLRIGS